MRGPNISLIFLSYPQDISLWFSYGYLVLSLDISFLAPEYFIADFIWMPGTFILPVRVHLMECWDDGHMTHYLKWSKNKNCSPAL